MFGWSLCAQSLLLCATVVHGLPVFETKAAGKLSWGTSIKWTNSKLYLLEKAASYSLLDILIEGESEGVLPDHHVVSASIDLKSLGKEGALLKLSCVFNVAYKGKEPIEDPSSILNKAKELNDGKGMQRLFDTIKTFDNDAIAIDVSFSPYKEPAVRPARRLESEEGGGVEMSYTLFSLLLMGTFSVLFWAVGGYEKSFTGNKPSFNKPALVADVSLATAAPEDLENHVPLVTPTDGPSSPGFLSPIRSVSTFDSDSSQKRLHKSEFKSL